jgi:hypothetical protein
MNASAPGGARRERWPGLRSSHQAATIGLASRFLDPVLSIVCRDDTMGQLQDLREHIEYGRYAEALTLIGELEAMSRDDKIQKTVHC